MEWLIFALVALVVIYLLYAYSASKWPFSNSDDDDNIPSDAKTAEILEGETMVVKLSRIFRAVYGDFQTDRVIDVTPQLNAVLDKQMKINGVTGFPFEFSITPSNALAGEDPAVGVRKSLKITYK
jgi:hypothetical protein